MIRRPFPPRRRDQRGFSIVELLMVAFIMGTGLLGLAALETMAIRSRGGSKGRTAATYVAQTVLEAIELEGQYSYSQKISGQAFPLTRVYTNSATTSGNVGSFDVNGKFLSSSMSGVTNGVITAAWVRLPYKGATPASTLPQVQQFVVNVSWNDNGQAKWVSVSRMVRY